MPELRGSYSSKVWRDGDHLRVLREQYYARQRGMEKHREAYYAPSQACGQGSAVARIRSLMDRGFLKRHLEETSTQEELTLSYVPYWIIPVSARTNMVATDEI